MIYVTSISQILAYKGFTTCETPHGRSTGRVDNEAMEDIRNWIEKSPCSHFLGVRVHYIDETELVCARSNQGQWFRSAILAPHVRFNGR